MKEYALNIKTVDSDTDWNTTDMADWFKTYAEAFNAAEKLFENPEVLEAVITIWADGEVEGTPLHMFLENGIIVQYQGETRLWA